MDNSFLSTISYVDFIIVGALLLFIIIGIFRGFTNDILSLMTWVGAAMVTSLFFPYLQPIIRTYITEPFFADIVLGFLAFLLSLIILVAIAKSITRLVRKSILSGLDRTLGILSGTFRGALLLTVLYFGALMFWKPGETPEAFQKARLLPFINTCSKLVHQFLIPNEFFPKRLLNHMYGNNKVIKIDRSADSLLKSFSAPKTGPLKKKKDKPPATLQKKTMEKGYKTLERQALESLIDTVSPK